MKKFIALMLSAILMVSMIPVVFAEGDDLTLEVKNAECAVTEGTEVKVDVVSTENKGYASGIVTANWDNTVLELTKVEFNSELAPNNATAAVKNSGAFKVSFGDDMATANYEDTGTMFTLVFKVMAGAAAGDYNVSLSDFDVYDCNIKKVNVDSTGAYVTLKPPVEETTEASQAQETTEASQAQETTEASQVQETTEDSTPASQGEETTAPPEVNPTEGSTPSVTDATQPSSGSNVTAKKPNPAKVTVKAKKVKLKKLKKKSQKVKAITVKNAKGKVTYSIVKKGTTKKIKKFVKINKKGVITIKKWKKAKKGTYKIKVKIKVAGNKQYNAATFTKVVKVKIK